MSDVRALYADVFVQVSVNLNICYVKRWSPIFLKRPLAASPGSCPISICTRPRGSSDTGESFFPWLTGADPHLSLHEVEDSHHRTGCLTAHPFSPAPPGSAAVLVALTGPLLATSSPCWLWKAKRARIRGRPACAALRSQGPRGGADGRGRGGRAQGVRQGKPSKAEWREMLQSISNLMQQRWADEAFLFSVPGGESSEQFFKLKEGFGLDAGAHESPCDICSAHRVPNEKKKAYWVNK